MLGDDLDGKMMFEDVDVGVRPDSLDERFLDLESGVVGMVEDAELRVAAFAVEVEAAVFLLVEVNAPVDKLTYLSGSLGDNLSDSLRIAEPVAGYHCVVDVFLEIVYFEVGDRSHSALGEGRVGFIESGLADQGHFAL